MEVISETVRNSLANVINKNEMKDYKISISSASNKGDGYMGTLYRIEVNGKKNGEPITLNLVCKVPIADWKSRDIMNVQISFERETFVYNVILEDFKRFQLSKHITPNQMFTAYAKCYKADATTNGEHIIMEDLKAISFHMFDNRKKLDRAHTQLFVENLAKFNAISFAMKAQQPEEFKKYTNIPEVMIEILGRTKWNELCQFGLSQAISASEDPEHKKILTKIKETCEEVLHECLNGIGSEDYRIITHGDCWNNNMMFRYQDDIPIEICFLDWQHTRYTSPVIDLSNYFYLCTEKEFLDEHFDDLMDLYHDYLCRYIRLLGSDPELLYPYAVFKSDLNKFAKFGLIICSFALNFHLLKSESAPDLEEIAKEDTGNESSLVAQFGLKDDHARKTYDRRIRDVIQHAFERNYI